MNGSKFLTPFLHNARETLDVVCLRIHNKMRDYATYQFSGPQSCAINVFFDLVQEFDEAEKIHALTVLILRMFFRYDSELYIKDENDVLTLMTPAVHPEIVGLPDIRSEVWRDSGRYFIPVRGRGSTVVTRGTRIVAGTDFMGVLVVHCQQELNAHDLLFLEKYANRVGFCLHNKTLAIRNARHILFVRKLTHDIGHNIVTPNMRLKLQLNHLEKYIEELGGLAEQCDDPVQGGVPIRMLQRQMNEQMKDILGTFKNSALFLESLLRQSHFDVGHYVLRLSKIDIGSQVILPQFERYRNAFKERGLFVADDQPAFGVTQCIVEADLGLISQVLANLLSNAVKYASVVHEGKHGEVRCGLDVVPEAFGGDKDGVKVWVFSSGPSLPSPEAGRLFEDNFRGSNAAGQSGSGHGLFFVSEITAEHGGIVGYEAANGGNVFYFMLPRVSR